MVGGNVSLRESAMATFLDRMFDPPDTDANWFDDDAGTIEAPPFPAP
jgi:hypothetical protein